jgi:hypothetical protein
MFDIIKCGILKVTIKYIAVKISHLQTVYFWNITPNMIKLLKYHTIYIQNIYRITPTVRISHIRIIFF